MSDSMGAAYRASNYGKKSGQKQGKHKQEGDTPDAREKRILLYLSRANVNPESEKHERLKGENGRPIDLFTGLEVSAEELEVIEIDGDDESDE